MRQRVEYSDALLDGQRPRYAGAACSPSLLAWPGSSEMVGVRCSWLDLCLVKARRCRCSCAARGAYWGVRLVPGQWAVRES
jgi:hypothetical protein